ncbi:MAG: TetR/AcrR family transcriptional regulator [Cyclobacteriaceae bacterium]|nr:TetR/AcrR family transcriptional regulator [Cyclobacteriaceae bacterium]
MEKRGSQTIISSSKALFWKHGIKRVSVEEICEHAGISKMTFYRHFKNKNEVAEKVLLKILDKGISDYLAIMNQPIPYPKKIEKIIELKHHSSDHISQEFLKDIYQNEKLGLVKHVQEYTVKFTAQLVKDFKDAQKKGFIRKDLKIEFILILLDNFNTLLFDKRITDTYKDSHDAIMEITNFLFYGILPRDKEV